MARPSRCRKVCLEPEYDTFIPGGIPSQEEVCLTVDEYEAVRLIDYEKRTHEQCARQMDISRTTVTEMYERARFKLADCVINGKTLRIFGGHYRLCREANRKCRKSGCAGQPEVLSEDLTTGTERENTNRIVKQKGAFDMRVAVTYENGEIFQHFGHTQQFKFYDVEDEKIVREQVVDTMGSGHGALAGFLKENDVDALICGGIGGGAQSALAEIGIQLYGGVSGSADEAVGALISGNLGYNPNISCSHHDHGEHSCGNHGGHSCQEHGEHSCGEDRHGCAGR